MRKLTMLALFVIIALQSLAFAAVAVRADAGAALLAEDGSEIVAPGVYDDLLPLNASLFAAQTEGRWVLLNADGKRLTDALYDAIRVKNGAILAEAGGLTGVLNSSGEESFPVEYADITPTENGFLLLGSDGTLFIDGEPVADAPRASQIGEIANDGLLAYRDARNNRFGFLDSDGRIAIEPKFDYADRFIRGAAVVTSDGARGLIDANGGWILPSEYDFLEISEAGFALAWKRGEGANVFDLNGRLIASYPGENSAGLIGDGWMIRGAEALRVYDPTGGLRLEIPADASISAGIGDALIVADGAWGEKCVYLVGGSEAYQNLFPLGSSHGEPIYGYMQAPTARYMNDLLGETQISTDMDAARYGVTDLRGKPLTDCVYHSIEFLADDRLLARTDDGWQMIDACGNVIWSAAAIG